ncbi:DinB family protein [Paenibacillus sp. sptzw28]|uniref:DinB family protein n=1 Tax=Paenibacillus sp. sptzw28 TaxID=715179 RepID=UPI001C6E8DD2|nr:DinB family protein [Paenibacillus sp. sptzw28]QYR19556.1 DinB family protein [Paenibacillus sp. sptzw28]
MMRRPALDEYAPYFDTYVRLVPKGNIEELLTAQLEEMVALSGEISDEQSSYRYAAGKWSLKQVLGHIIDNERVWAYRMLRIARGDAIVFQSYDQDKFMQAASFDSLTLKELIDDYSFVRRSTLTLLRGLSEESRSRQGELYGKPLTARAAAYVIAGHELHHLAVIKQKYLSPDLS